MIKVRSKISTDSVQSQLAIESCDFACLHGILFINFSLAQPSSAGDIEETFELQSRGSSDYVCTRQEANPTPLLYSCM